MIITVFDRPQFIEAALRSIEAQTEPEWEIVLVDDGQVLDLAAVVSPFGSRLTLVAGPGRGPGPARNVGIEVARGDWVLFLDDDDLLRPTALASLLEAAEGGNGHRWAAGRFRYIDVDGNQLPRIPRGQFESGDVYGAMILGCQFGPPAVVLVRRDLVASYGRFQDFRFFEDHDLWLSIARDHPVAATDVVVALYRVHGAQATSNWRISNEGTLKVLEKHRLRARPGFAAEFTRAWAQASLRFGDELYLHGAPVEARRRWSEAASADPDLNRAGLRYRWLKSFVPGPLLAAGRLVARRLRSGRHRE